MRLWSSEAEGFISQNGEVLGVIDRISSRAKKRGVYVIDRGGDGDWLFDGLGRLCATENGTATSRQTPNQTRSGWSFWNDLIFWGKSWAPKALLATSKSGIVSFHDSNGNRV